MFFAVHRRNWHIFRYLLILVMAGVRSVDGGRSGLIWENIQVVAAQLHIGSVCWKRSHFRTWHRVWRLGNVLTEALLSVVSLTINGADFSRMNIFLNFYFLKLLYINLDNTPFCRFYFQILNDFFGYFNNILDIDFFGNIVLIIFFP